MRISYLLTQSLESPSGIGRFWPMAKEMAKLGHIVNIFALHPDYENLDKKRLQRDDVSIEYVAPMHVQKQNNTKSYYSSTKLTQIALHASWQLIKKALLTPSDIIHICKPHPMNSLAGLAARYLRGKVLFLDCDDFEAGIGHFKSTWQKRGVTFFERYMPLKVQMTTTNTYFMHSKLISWGVPENRIAYIPNGIDRERFSLHDPQKVESLRHGLDLENKPVIGYIGTIGLSSHAVDLLIDAFAIVRHNLPNSVLLIVGGGEDYQTLQAYSQSLGINESIRWVGRVSQELIPIYFQLANVTVDPVRDDLAAHGRSPLKLFESWAAAIPFISADVGDRSYLLGSPLAGLLVKPGDPQSLANAILRLLKDQKLSLQLMELGSQRIKRYHWDVLAGDLETQYRRFASN